MRSIAILKDKSCETEKFEHFCYDKEIQINIGDKGTVQIKLSDKSYAVFSKEELLDMLSYMEHNHYFLKVPKYFLMECINQVYHPTINKRQYYGIGNYRPWV